MAASLQIKDGNPVWDSQSLVPSKDTVLSPNMPPSLATINVSSTDVFVYVKVDNVGTVDLGAFTCTTALPAPWAAPILFAGFLANVNGSTTQSQGGVTFKASTAGDSLSGGVSILLSSAVPNRRAWAWSPDGQLFAYASSVSGTDWHLTIVTLQSITRADGSTVAKGQLIVSGAMGLFAGAWTQNQFGWAGSKGVNVAGQGAGGSGIAIAIACPYAPAAANTWGTTLPDMAGSIAYAFVPSPCGSIVAILPKILVMGGGPANLSFVSTSKAQVVSVLQNNAPISVGIAGANPSISTITHGAKGVAVNTGAGTVNVDDPDCTSLGGGITVAVDRVKASTLPTANLGVLSIGTASLGSLAAGKSMWVQVPNTNVSGWANQSEQHWCLLGQAFTSDGTTIPRPWNGQATNPPAFPITLINCAQRNIAILP